MAVPGEICAGITQPTEVDSGLTDHGQLELAHGFLAS